ncbi:hypothetical protein J4E90_003142 [Alternaria incomplexa]|uniref:uncharacterized protein n=1 Tax=Alternaria incomplexa TaxID=1187928 RepID=UPI002220CAEC|nr:uncharacterized protein J4E90_003142 [Alternaria incomplexa]KAI4918754.1 hypothetical protein J4E90_003142 [Alternaria incomplexa]
MQSTNPEQDERKPAFRPFFNTPSSRNQNQAYVEDDEDDSFIPHAASHSPQGPRWRRPRTAGNQGGDQPMTRQAINDLFASEEPTNSRNDDATDEGDATITELTTATEELDASSSHSVPAGEDVGDSTIISLIDSTEDSIDLDTSRGESSFQEQDTLTSVPAIQGLHVSAPSAAQVPSGLPQTGGGEVEPKEDVTMIDASKDLDNVEVTDKQEQ